MMKTTTAQQVSALLDDDGQQWTTNTGEEFDPLCRRLGARIIRDHRDPDKTRHEFADGSAIIATGDAWDMVADGCAAFCWAGVGCDCEAGR